MKDSKAISGFGETRVSNEEIASGENAFEAIGSKVGNVEEPKIIVDYTLQDEEIASETVDNNPKKTSKGVKSKIAAILAAGAVVFANGSSEQDYEIEPVLKENNIKDIRDINSSEKTVAESLVPVGMTLVDLLKPVNVVKYGYGEIVEKDGKTFVKLKKGYYLDKQSDTISKK